MSQRNVHKNMLRRNLFKDYKVINILLKTQTPQKTGSNLAAYRYSNNTEKTISEKQSKVRKAVAFFQVTRKMFMIKVDFKLLPKRFEQQLRKG